MTDNGDQLMHARIINHNHDQECVAKGWIKTGENSWRIPCGKVFVENEKGEIEQYTGDEAAKYFPELEGDEFLKPLILKRR